MTIGMIDAVAGSGKTTEMIKEAIEWSIRNKRPVNISLPTKEVIEEKYKDAVEFADGRIKVERVHSGICENVANSLDAMLTEIGSHKPALLFTTHRTFLDCPNWIGAKDWKFYLDELFDPVEFVLLRLPHNYSILTDILEVVDPSAKFSEVRRAPGKKKALERMLTGQDDVDRVFEAVTSRLALPDRWKIYVECENYLDVARGAGKSTLVDEREKAAELLFWIVLEPWFEREGLDVTMASACFTDRLAYKLWNKSGSTFVADQAVLNGLQSRAHNGAGIEFHCMNIKYWSAWAKNGWKNGKNLSATPQKELEKLPAKIFGEEPYIFCMNSDWKGKLAGSGLKVNVVQHGKNEYIDYRNVAFMPSLLPVPYKWEFLLWLGLTENDIRCEYYHSNAYQSVFRTAARRPDRKEKVKALLPDRAVCEYLRSKAPGSEIIEHEVLAPRQSRGRPKKYADPQTRKAANALRMRNKRALSRRDPKARKLRGRNGVAPDGQDVGGCQVHSATMGARS